MNRRYAPPIHNIPADPAARSKTIEMDFAALEQNVVEAAIGAAPARPGPALRRRGATVRHALGPGGAPLCRIPEARAQYATDPKDVTCRDCQRKLAVGDR